MNNKKLKPHYKLGKVRMSAAFVTSSRVVIPEPFFTQRNVPASILFSVLYAYIDTCVHSHLKFIYFVDSSVSFQERCCKKYLLYRRGSALIGESLSCSPSPHTCCLSTLQHPAFCPLHSVALRRLKHLSRNAVSYPSSVS